MSDPNPVDAMTRGLSILQAQIERHAKLCRNDMAHDHQQLRALEQAVAIFDGTLAALRERGEREKRLREALRKYGKHAAACYEPTVFYGPPGGSSYTSGKVKECVCGLARALAEGGDDENA